MIDVLLVGKDWQARALLRAQLIEDGIGAEAWETVAEALASVTARPRVHRLVVADLHSSVDPVTELEHLSGWARRVPVWVIASHSFLTEDQLQDRGFERVLVRPVDLGKLVEEIKQRLRRPSGRMMRGEK